MAENNEKQNSVGLNPDNSATPKELSLENFHKELTTAINNTSESKTKNDLSRISRAFNTVLDKVKQAGDVVVDKVNNKVKPIADKVKQAGDVVVDKVNNKVKPIVDKVNNKVKPIVDKVNNKVKQAGDQLAKVKIKASIQIAKMFLTNPDLLMPILSQFVPPEFPGTSLKAKVDPKDIVKLYKNLIKSPEGKKLKSAIIKILSSKDTINYISDAISDMTKFEEQNEKIANAINGLGESLSVESPTFFMDIVSLINNPKLITNIQTLLDKENVNQETLLKLFLKVRDGLTKLAHDEELPRVVQLMNDAFDWATDKHNNVKPPIPDDLNPELKNLFKSHLDDLEEGEFSYSKMTDVYLHFAYKYKDVINDVAEIMGKDGFSKDVITILQDPEIDTKIQNLMSNNGPIVNLEKVDAEISSRFGKSISGFSDNNINNNTSRLATPQQDSFNKSQKEQGKEKEKGEAKEKGKEPSTFTR